MGVTKAVKQEPDLLDDLPVTAGLKSSLPFVMALTLIYVFFVVAAMHRGLWYDELFTLDIANASTSGRVIELIHKWDLNPPLSYFLSRWSMQVFGRGKIWLRLPSVIEFYVASLLLFAFARRRIGNAFALLALLILWEGPQFYYAVEARPYALLLMFFSALLFCWDKAISINRPTWSLLGIFFASLGMLMSHVFAALSLSAIVAAEIVRCVRTRKADFSLWIALLLPCVAMLTYIPLFRIYKPVIFPYQDQASLLQIRLFFQQSVWDCAAVVYASMLALAMPRSRREKAGLPTVRPELIVAACVLLSTPVILNLVLMPSQRAFWPRYCITASAATCVIYTFLFAYGSRVGRVGGYAAAAVVLLFGVRNGAYAVSQSQQAGSASVLLSIAPDLPLVVENGLTFFEMNQFESANLLNRTYYLKNRPAAVLYSHGTLFEDFEPPDRLDPEFNIRAHVDDYSSFIEHHPRFIVLTSGAGAYWLMRKLHADGEHIEKVGDVNIPYRDSELYLVNVTKPEASTRPKVE